MNMAQFFHYVQDAPWYFHFLYPVLQILEGHCQTMPKCWMWEQARASCLSWESLKPVFIGKGQTQTKKCWSKRENGKRFGMRRSIH